MPKELTALEEFDIISELQFPDFIYSTDSLEEKIAFSKMIRGLSINRIIILDDILLNFPYISSGLTESHIEILIKEGDYISKSNIFKNFANPYFLEHIQEIISELDRRDKTTENSTRLENIIQYLKDNKNII